MRLACLLALAAGCFRFEAKDPPAPPNTPDAPLVIDAPVDAASLSEISQALLEEWSGCLSLANMQIANMEAWGSLQASNGQRCDVCHSVGEQGFIATIDELLMFDTITKHKQFMLQYFTVDLASGAENAKIVINTRSFLDVSTGQAPHAGHPTFNPTTNAGMTALQELFNRTAARKVAGTCDPPRLID